MLDKYDVLSYNDREKYFIGKREIEMKRLFSVLMALILVFSIAAVAEGTDFASMDDAALHAMIDGARNELAKRELVAAENTVLFEQDGVTVYLTGDHEVWGSDSYYLDLGVVLVNDSDKTVAVGVNTAYGANTQQMANPILQGIQKPRQPESTVQQMDIKIPDFLKNSRK